MEKKKISRKVIKSQLTDSMREAIGKLELPQATKKVKKMIRKSASKMATEFAVILKKEEKKSRKVKQTLTYVEDVLAGNKKKSNKVKINKQEVVPA